MTYYNPFSLLFEDTNEFSIHNTIPLPETSTTPIENTKANLSKTQLSKDTGEHGYCSLAETSSCIMINEHSYNFIKNSLMLY